MDGFSGVVPAGTGWTCQACNSWVPINEYHNCPMMTPAVPQYHYHYYQSDTEQLKRIADALERLEVLLKERIFPWRK